MKLDRLKCWTSLLFTRPTYVQDFLELVKMDDADTAYLTRAMDGTPALTPMPSADMTASLHGAHKAGVNSDKSQQVSPHGPLFCLY